MTEYIYILASYEDSLVNYIFRSFNKALEKKKKLINENNEEYMNDFYNNLVIVELEEGESFSYDDFYNNIYKIVDETQYILK